MTTFDLAIYSMILNLQTQGKDPPILSCQRLKKSNTKKFADDEVGLRLARLTFISFGEKFRDDKLDGGSAKTGFLNLLYNKPIKEARKVEPELAKISYEGTEKINVLQNAGAPLMEIFACYGDMMAEIFNQFTTLDDNYRNLFKALGQWTFFVDMVCDYAEDYKNGTYNGFKTEGLATFVEYFNLHYIEFSQVEKQITENLLSALYSIKQDNSVWHTLFKIITQAVDNVIPALTEGKDVTFHYFKELRKQHRNLVKEKKFRAIYQGEKNEKN